MMKHSAQYDYFDYSPLIRAMSSLADRFRNDYSDLISDHIGQENNHKATFGNVTLHILRGTLELPGHDRAEYVVLENTDDYSHVVLLGERLKKSLRFGGGIAGFLTEEKDPVGEVKKLFTLWDEVFAPAKEEHELRRFRIMSEFTALFPEIPFEEAADIYLTPIFKAENPRFKGFAPSTRPAKPASAKRRLSGRRADHS